LEGQLEEIKTIERESETLRVRKKRGEGRDNLAVSRGEDGERKH